MSNTQKSVAPVSFPATTLADRENITACVNLRPDPTTGGLAAVGRPRLIASLPGAKPVEGGEYTLSDGTYIIIVLHAGALKAVSSDGSVTVIAEAAGLKDTPVCILPVDGGIIVMFAASRACRYACTPGASAGMPVTWTRTDLFPDLPPLMFVRNDVGRIGVTIPDFTLKSTYTSTTQSLTDEDGEEVDRIMGDAYHRLSDKALARGWYIQPVLARYRLIGNNGEVLYTSAPVIVAPDKGFQATKTTLTLTGQGLRNVGEASLSAAAFVPTLIPVSQPDAAWHRLVRDIETEYSPQFHPYLSSLPGSTSRLSYSANGLQMLATLPGINPAVSDDEADPRMAKLVMAAIDHQELAFKNPLPQSTAVELSMLESIRKFKREDESADNDFETAVSAPNTFTAASVSRSGDTIAWGGIRAIPFSGYALHEMGILHTQATLDKAPTAVEVTMRDGSTVVRDFVSKLVRVTALSPLIVYPSPDAVSITLLSAKDGVTLPLTPSPCRKFAYYLNPTFRPITFNEDRGGFALPSASPALREYPSGILITKANEPLRPIALSVGDGSDVHTVRAVGRRSNALTAPSSLFYAFSAAGISSVSLSSTHKRLNINMLDRRGVLSPKAVASIPDGVAALADGALLTVTGTSSRLTTLLDGSDARMLGWCGRHNEMWCIPAESDKPVTVVSPDGKVRYTREGVEVADVSTGGSHTALFTSGGDILDSAHEEDGLTTVRHAATLHHGHMQNAEVVSRVGLFGNISEGELAFDVSDGAPGCERAKVQSHTLKPDNYTCATELKMRLPESICLHRRVSATTMYPSTLSITRR